MPLDLDSSGHLLYHRVVSQAAFNACKKQAYFSYASCGLALSTCQDPTKSLELCNDVVNACTDSQYTWHCNGGTTSLTVPPKCAKLTYATNQSVHDVCRFKMPHANGCTGALDDYAAASYTRCAC